MFNSIGHRQISLDCLSSGCSRRMSFCAAPVPRSLTLLLFPRSPRLRGVKCFTLRCIEIHLKTIFLSGHLHKTHSHTHSHNKQWSEVNLLDILYALNARRTSSSSTHPRLPLLESIKCVFGPLSASSAARPPPEVVAVCLPDSDRIRSETETRSPAAFIFRFSRVSIPFPALATVRPSLFCRHASLSPLISR